RSGLRGRLDRLGLGVLLALARVEELDAVGFDLELLPAAVLAVPLGVVQPALDGDLAALGEELLADLGLASEDGDVDVVGALVLAVLAGALHRKPEVSGLDSLALGERGVGREAAGELDYLELASGWLGAGQHRRVSLASVGFVAGSIWCGAPTCGRRSPRGVR